jgi:hypothetical protein
MSNLELYSLFLSTTGLTDISYDQFVENIFNQVNYCLANWSISELTDEIIDGLTFDQCLQVYRSV